MNILSAPVDNGACGLYRVRQPFAALNKLYKDMNCDVLKPDHGKEVILKAIEMSDIMIIRQSKSNFMRLVKGLQSIYEENNNTLKTKMVYDLDDNLFDWSPFVDAYQSCGLKEIRMDECMSPEWFKTHPQDKDKWMWKDGENGFNLERNKEGADAILKALQMADLITTPNQALSDFYAKLSGNPNAIVLPNCVDFSQWWNVKMEKEGIRIGWHGGASHYVDLETIRERLIEVVEREKYTYVHVGSKFEDSFAKSAKVECIPWVETPAHPYRQALLNLDIGIIPLAKFNFNRFKSDIKWVEYSALKIPCVVANAEPYNLVIEDGVTGFLYDSPDEMEEKLLKLAKSHELCQKMGQAAYEWCFENRNSEKQAKLWYKEYTKLSMKQPKIVKMPERYKKLPYLIYSPKYDHASAGIRALYSLRSDLESRGYESHIVSMTLEGKEEGTLTISQAKEMVSRGAVAVYPEVVVGNPFGASIVARYVLNRPGVVGGSVLYNNNELVFYYSDILRPYIHNEIQGKLHMPTIESEIFNSTGKEKREGICYYVGKGTFKPDMLPTDKKRTAITRWPNFPKTRPEVAELLRTSEAFYCFDNFTAMEHEAALCGCPTVIIPDGTVSEAEKELDELGRDGIAFGVENLPKALTTVHKAQESYQRVKDEYQKDLSRFIDITQGKQSV